MKIARFLALFFIIILALCSLSNCQLVVNVKNKGGDLLKESINANTTQDTVTLEFNNADGTHIMLFIDMKNEIQITRAVIMGELDLGQDGYQVMCFITRFQKTEFISSDAMSKLRQKNPGAIRHPEEEKGTETITFDLQIRLDHAYVLSPFIHTVCSQAKEASYIRDADLKALSRSLNKSYSTLVGATSSVNPTEETTHCSSMDTYWRTCVCVYNTCVGWYPCGLKYCRGKDSTGKVVSYRCGIKTCSICRRFEYVVQQKKECIWYNEKHEGPYRNSSIHDGADVK